MSTPTSVGQQDLDLDVELMIDEGAVASVSAGQVSNLVKNVLIREGTSGAWTITVVLTTDERLRALHKDFMGIDEYTDVMTFPTDAGGDIVVSVERAGEQAGEYGHTLHEEITFLVVHGLLHLCGWTDEMPAERDAMLARQEFLIAGVGGLTPG